MCACLVSNRVFQMCSFVRMKAFQSDPFCLNDDSLNFSSFDVNLDILN